MTLLSHKSGVFVSSSVINTITNGVGQKESGTERCRQPWCVCVRLLCNLWQRGYMFVVFHFDNHLLTTGRQHKLTHTCFSVLVGILYTECITLHFTQTPYP